MNTRIRRRDREDKTRGREGNEKIERGMKQKREKGDEIKRRS